MESNDDPRGIQARQKHRAFLTHAYSALEAATELARGFFYQPDHPSDGSLFSHLVRYHFARQSRDPDLGAQFGFRLHVLPNTGVEVISRGDRIKVWRATEDSETTGLVPAPGDSAGRLRFCDQPQAPLFAEGLYQILNPGKLVLLWDIDFAGALSLVRLACPWYWDTPWELPKTHWNIPVPHPAEWIESDDFTEQDLGLGLEMDPSHSTEES